MYKQGKRGNVFYSAVGGGVIYNGHNILTPRPNHHHLLLHQPKVLCSIGMEIEL